MDISSRNSIEQLIEVEVREQLRNLPSAFRKYCSEINLNTVMNDAIERLPRSFQRLGENYHDRHLRQMRVKIAVERAISDLLHELKFYYVVRSELDNEEDIPTEPLTDCPLPRCFSGPS